MQPKAQVVASAEPAEVVVPQELNRFAELHRKISITAGTRFHAARRLARHAKYSQWTIAMLSVLLILVSLVPALGLKTEMSAPYLNAVQVGLAVLVLVFSLLISMDNHSVKADKMHRCGIELGRLARKLETFRTREGSDQDYQELSEQYFEILNQYDNHEHVDYLFQQLTLLKKKYPAFFSKGYWSEVAPAACSCLRPVFCRICALCSDLLGSRICVLESCTIVRQGGDGWLARWREGPFASSPSISR